MKSTHLAKADFLRSLFDSAIELYQLGDFTSSDPTRKLQSSRLEGFIHAGKVVCVASEEEMQSTIDRAHLRVFQESREKRKNRLMETWMQERISSHQEDSDHENWEKYDSPASLRRNK